MIYPNMLIISIDRSRNGRQNSMIILLITILLSLVYWTNTVQRQSASMVVKATLTEPYRYLFLPMIKPTWRVRMKTQLSSVYEPLILWLTVTQFGYTVLSAYLSVMMMAKGVNLNLIHWICYMDVSESFLLSRMTVLVVVKVKS